MQVFAPASTTAAQPATTDATAAQSAPSRTTAVDQTQQLRGPSVLLLQLAASLLQLRGSSPSTSPLQDSSGNVLCFNGEVFGGLDVPDGGNDGKCLLAALEALHSKYSQQEHKAHVQQPEDEQQQQQVQQSEDDDQQQQHIQLQQSKDEQQQQQQQQEVTALLSKLRGPWSLIYWQAASRTLWFGRDWLGETQQCCVDT
jgi:hypothetical protein